MNKALLHREVQEFISENYDKDLARLAFQGSPFEGVSTQELATQLAGKKKAEKKLPTWFRTQGILYPPNINLEQTSSEITAAYKASLIEGGLLMDLTGGFGIDSFYFSKRFNKVIHCELDPELSELVAHNSRVLEAENIQTLVGDGLAHLEASNEVIDWIYLDPARRDNAGGKVFHLSDCLPDVPEHLELLFSKTSNLLIKTSPLLDLQAGILAREQVKQIHVVAVRNEVKELLWVLSEGPSEEVKIRTVNFKKKGPEVYENVFRKESLVDYSVPLAYLYEPNAAIMKSGLADALGEELGLLKLHPNSQLFTSQELREFPGRRFKVLQSLPYSRKKLKKALSFDQAHIATRNFPESVARLRKQFKLKDGGDKYLFFTTTWKEEKLVVVGEKILAGT